jgi:putative ATP-dependent endonuclease of the OLD family
VKLQEVTVQNYRSITTQTKFDVTDLTILVGPNNEGKSNLLRALRLGMRVVEILAATPSGAWRDGSAPLYLLNRMRRFQHSNPAGPDYEEELNYRWDRDYPLSKQSKSGAHPTVIRLTFNLEQDEVRRFREKIGVATNGTLPIEIKLTRT